MVPVIGPHPPADPQARLTSHLPFEFTFALALSVTLLRSGHGVFFGGKEVGLSVGFRVDVGADVFVGGTKVGFAVRLAMGVDVEASVSAEVDSEAGVAEGNPGAGVSLGLAAAVNSPSITRVAATAVYICSSESS